MASHKARYMASLSREQGASLGWKTNLVLDPLLKTVGLTPEVVRRVNLLRGWCLVKCINPER